VSLVKLTESFGLIGLVLMIVLLPTLLHVVVAPDKELVSTLFHTKHGLIVDCSSIEKVDEVRCAKGKCVVGESLLPLLAVPLLTPRLMPQGLLRRFDRWHLCCPRSILVQPPNPREEVGS
jgi:hypothetical protein